MKRDEASKILTASRKEHMTDCHGFTRKYGDLTGDEKKVYDAFTLAISELSEREGTEKIVVVKHFGYNWHYLFSVPKYKDLNEGDTVLVRAKNGEIIVKCVCDSFEVSDGVLKALAAKYGATLPLASVIGVMQPEWW